MLTRVALSTYHDDTELVKQNRSQRLNQRWVICKVKTQNSTSNRVDPIGHASKVK